ncbi:synaptic vesicle glycoprotein 2B-like [Neocloeon triangulifer]|uniref:synaptic vesicle glycoprotein 2B-like n=1 Tax=Neocloeon triangulifer TaxID=2078957 RepID=UPI00286F48CD|nr:synaptic vesicle glycoprotein 2B-like [Neocloeon triangulifer]XP_059473713.1 synaptic vesicle glycoprotein 2B-like [Neocloeon triangulifer]
MVVSVPREDEEASDENAALVSGHRRPATYTMMDSVEPHDDAVVAAASSQAGAADHPSTDTLEFGGAAADDASLLSQFHEDAIKQAGLGTFQMLLLLVAGLGLAADSVEVFVVFYILPSAEVEMCITQVEKDWMGAITFVGMMVGATLWGNLADRMGRRRTLLSALGVNAGFSVIAAFMPTYGTFMTARFCSAVGVGGSLPVAYAYYSEFLPRSDRGRFLSGLVMMWSLGGVYVALLAWIILPRTGLQVAEDSSEHFSAWHQFLLLCTLPCFAAIAGLIFSPESPRHLLEAGQDVEAMLAYQRIFKSNSKKGAEGAGQYQLSELELPTKRINGLGGPYASSSPGKSVLADMIYSLELFWNSFVQLFCSPHVKLTVTLLVIWISAAFGFYGLTLWFPEYIRTLRDLLYSSKAQHVFDKTYFNITFNRSLENINFSGSRFISCRFEHLTLSHVLFENCTMEACTFANVRSSRTLFRDSEISKSHFVDTDLWWGNLPYKKNEDEETWEDGITSGRFEHCNLVNNSILSLSQGCHLDFDYNLHLQDIFTENLVGQLALLPGALVCAFLVDRVGRIKIIGVTFLLAALISPFIWLLDSGRAIIAFESVLNLFFVAGWSSLAIATLESYPTHLRSTGFGFLAAISRLGAVLGFTTFSHLLRSSRGVPAMLSAACFAVAGFTASRLPEARTALL